MGNTFEKGQISLKDTIRYTWKDLEDEVFHPQDLEHFKVESDCLGLKKQTPCCQMLYLSIPSTSWIANLWWISIYAVDDELT